MLRASANWAGGGWLSQSNSYVFDSVKKLTRDYQAGSIAHPQDLGEYVAASSPLHVVDGWSFLGRALAAHIHGDSQTAQDLAYYAELRAAMGLLASEGIGIFNDCHVIVNSNGEGEFLRVPAGRPWRTHYITWEALDTWSSGQECSNLLGSVIRAGDKSLQDWRGAFSANASLLPQGGDWLKTWGLDIKQMSSDRDARNDSAYRPRRPLAMPTLPVRDRADFLLEIWGLLEPSPVVGFPSLDRFLIRQALETWYESENGRPPSRSDPTYVKTIDNVVAQIIDPGAGVTEWVEFLTRTPTFDDPKLLQLARKNDVVHGPEKHLEVLARAALLLRVATGSATLLIRTPGTTPDDLSAWWLALASERGIVPPQIGDVTSDQFWEEIPTSKEVLDPDTSWPSLWNLLSASPREVAILTECERISISSMGPWT